MRRLRRLSFSGNGVVLAAALVLGGTSLAACQDPEAGVLVNVQLESGALPVSELRLSIYAVGREGQGLTATLSQEGGALPCSRQPAVAARQSAV